MLSRGMGRAKSGISGTDNHDIARGGKHAFISVLVAPKTTGVCSSRKTRGGTRCPEGWTFPRKTSLSVGFQVNPAGVVAQNPKICRTNKPFPMLKAGALCNQNNHAMSGVLAVICVVVWIYLIAGRGNFWFCGIRDTGRPVPELRRWPVVVVVVPARNESKFIAASVRSLLGQDYAGEFELIVVDDDSSDGTAATAMHAAESFPAGRMTVIESKGPPPGWTGKLWAQNQGIAAAENLRPEYLLLTDADIEHAPDTLTWLVRQSSASQFALTSLMAKLRCESLAERTHVPAFIYFFQMLFPFSWVSQPGSSTAAAAGGCMLVRADALANVGGIASVRNALIDDCSLAAKMKTIGPIWLGLSDRVHSNRPYQTFSDVRRMISRSAYAQLRYSPFLLAATLAGMAITFMAPPLLAICAAGLPRFLGLLAWLAMTISFLPTLRFYRLSPLWSLSLPAIAGLYLYYTLSSAYQFIKGQGGEWKGRIHADATSLQ
jgi:hopene-associated glycosyltransferase HpnB